MGSWSAVHQHSDSAAGSEASRLAGDKDRDKHLEHPHLSYRRNPGSVGAHLPERHWLGFQEEVSLFLASIARHPTSVIVLITATAMGTVCG